MNTTLAVIKREKSGKATRAAKQVPAIVYGPKQKPIKLAIETLDLEKLMRDAGESTIINLQGLDEEVEVLIQDVEFDAARGGVSHVDFYAIERGKELTTNVPLSFVGEAPVEKTDATVNKVLHDIEVTCRPSNLPSEIEVDISVLETESDHILIKDLKIPEGVTLSADPEDVVVTVAAAREEEPEEPVEAPDMDAIEVEAKGKEVEEGEGEATETTEEEK